MNESVYASLVARAAGTTGMGENSRISMRNSSQRVTHPSPRSFIDICTGLSKRNGAKLRESFCLAAASHSRPRQAGA